MKTLAERQADRVTRKVEHALIERVDFDPSRAGVGQVDRRYVPADEAAAIDAGTNGVIAHAADALGVPMPDPLQEAVEPVYAHKVRVGGI